MDAAKEKSLSPAGLTALRLLLLLVVGLCLGQTRVWGFEAAPHPTSGQIAFASALAVGEIAPAVAYDASDSLVAAETPLSNSQLIQEVATRAENAVGGSGRFAGTAKHAYADELLTRYQNIYGQRGLVTESTWLNGASKPYGTAGAVRIDVLDTTSSLAYDYKFTLRPPGLSQSRIQQIMTHGPNLNGVIEVNP